jgi:hypothetical protein
MELILKSSPNNELTLALQSLGSTRKKGNDSFDDNRKTRLATHYANCQREIIQGRSGGVILHDYGLSSETVVSRSGLERAKEAKTRSLDFIHEFQRTRPDYEQWGFKYGWHCRLRAGYGFSPRRTKFTRLARHRILCGGSLLEKKSQSPAESTFITLTVPGDNTRTSLYVSNWSSYIVNRLLQYVRRDPRNKESGSYSWFYCWENQKRGVLHLHLVLHHAAEGASKSLGDTIARAWYRILSDVSEKSFYCLFSRRGGKECVVSTSWQYDVSPVYKSVACYISKYVSKGVSTASTSGSRGFFAPARWWGMSRSLKRAIDRNSSRVVVENLSEAVATEVFLELERLIKSFDVVQSYDYSFDLSYGSYHVGSGRVVKFYLSREHHESLSVSIGIGLSTLLRRFSQTLSATPIYKGSNWLYRQARGILPNCQNLSFAVT